MGWNYAYDGLYYPRLVAVGRDKINDSIKQIYHRKKQWNDMIALLQMDQDNIKELR